MPYHEFLWTSRTIQKVEDNGLSVAEVEFAVRNAFRRVPSNSSDRDVYFGRTQSGEMICVPFDEVDAVVLAPVTAFKV